MSSYKVPLPKCPLCESHQGVIRYGYSKTKAQRYRCMACQKSFQLKYIYSREKHEAYC
ncbi:Transposase and inactivated derivatives [Leminorella richardii]|uniref:Transposase and inactivated derivatives n=1 Tax=Leminorella richardii TaxID=158841 RepID=A0A2X4V3S2_9GAMM|nr:Transposase and inactivated derivatives [Leminorella richardii]